MTPRMSKEKSVILWPFDYSLNNSLFYAIWLKKSTVSITFYLSYTLRDHNGHKLLNALLNWTEHSFETIKTSKYRLSWEAYSLNHPLRFHYLIVQYPITYDEIKYWATTDFMTLMEFIISFRNMLTSIFQAFIYIFSFIQIFQAAYFLCHHVYIK